MRFVVLTVIKMSMLVFWVVMPCELVDKYQNTDSSPEDRGSTFLRNVGIYL
jgi:predicted permease